MPVAEKKPSMMPSDFANSVAPVSRPQLGHRRVVGQRFAEPGTRIFEISTAEWRVGSHLILIQGNTAPQLTLLTDNIQSRFATSRPNSASASREDGPFTKKAAYIPKV